MNFNSTLTNILKFFIILISFDYVLPHRGGSSLSERVSQLKDITLKKTVIHMNGLKFKEYVKSTPRNYSFIVMLTAMESHRQCSICGYVYDEFMVAVKSFRMTYGISDVVFFGVVDFDSGSDVFQLLKVNTAPVVMHFPPKGKMKNIDTLDMQRVGFSAEVIGRWITDRTELEFKVLRTPNYLGTFILFVTFFCGSVVMYFKQENIEYLQNKSVWAFIAVIFCLIMTSGQMWNHIRGPPFYHRSSSGVNVYVHGSSQGQFIVETYIVFLLNVGFVACIIGIIETNSSEGELRKRKKLLSIACMVSASFIFSLLLSIFRAKAGGYPYRGLL